MGRKYGKGKSERFHARQRFGERMGMTLTRRVHRELVARIREGKATFVERQSNRITLWRMDIRGESCVVVYDKDRKNIVTVLEDEE
jgi:hypothetical protein